MAEIYFIATGPLMWLKKFETDLAAQRFTITAVAPNGQRFDNDVDGMIEPIQLYRYITSEPVVPLALRTLMRGKIGSPGQVGLALPIWGMRQALGLTEIPDIGDPNDGPVMPVSTQHLQIAMIGYKKDPVGIIPATGVYQEKI